MFKRIVYARAGVGRDLRDGKVTSRVGGEKVYSFSRSLLDEWDVLDPKYIESLVSISSLVKPVYPRESDMTPEAFDSALRQVIASIEATSTCYASFALPDGRLMTGKAFMFMPQNGGRNDTVQDFFIGSFGYHYSADIIHSPVFLTTETEKLYPGLSAVEWDGKPDLFEPDFFPELPDITPGFSGISDTWKAFDTPERNRLLLKCVAWLIQNDGEQLTNKRALIVEADKAIAEMVIASMVYCFPASAAWLLPFVTHVDSPAAFNEIWLDNNNQIAQIGNGRRAHKCLLIGTPAMNEVDERRYASVSFRTNTAHFSINDEAAYMDSELFTMLHDALMGDTRELDEFMAFCETLSPIQKLSDVLVLSRYFTRCMRRDDGISAADAETFFHTLSVYAPKGEYIDDLSELVNIITQDYCMNALAQDAKAGYERLGAITDLALSQKVPVSVLYHAIAAQYNIWEDATDGFQLLARIMRHAAPADIDATSSALYQFIVGVCEKQGTNVQFQALDAAMCIILEHAEAKRACMPLLEDASMRVCIKNMQAISGDSRLCMLAFFEGLYDADGRSFNDGWRKTLRDTYFYLCISANDTEHLRAGLRRYVGDASQLVDLCESFCLSFCKNQPKLVERWLWLCAGCTEQQSLREQFVAYVRRNHFEQLPAVISTWLKQYGIRVTLPYIAHDSKSLALCTPLLRNAIGQTATPEDAVRLYGEMMPVCGAIRADLLKALDAYIAPLDAKQASLNKKFKSEFMLLSVPNAAEYPNYLQYVLLKTVKEATYDNFYAATNTTPIPNYYPKITLADGQIDYFDALMDAFLSNRDFSKKLTANTHMAFLAMVQFREWDTRIYYDYAVAVIARTKAKNPYPLASLAWLSCFRKSTNGSFGNANKLAQVWVPRGYFDDLQGKIAYETVNAMVACADDRLVTAVFEALSTERDPDTASVIQWMKNEVLAGKKANKQPSLLERIFKR